jgi:perosamine synthetase
MPVGHDEIRCVADAVAEDRGVFHARAVERLQAFVARMAQRDYAFAVSGRRAAFFLALRALGLGAGDEILLPESADFSTAAAVLHCGAVPVFCDVDPHTLCLSPEAAAARISGRARGLVAVHMYGRTCAMGPLLELAAAHGLFVLEDAGTAVAALYRGRPAGAFGHLSVFSLNGPALPDYGGMVVSSDRELMRRVALMGGEGRSASDPLVYEFPAYDFALSDLAAAAASARMERLPELLAHKTRIVNRYRRILKDVPGVYINPEDAETRNSCIMPLLITERADAGGTAQRLRERGIIARPAFAPLSSMPAFTKADNPAAYAAADHALLLPGGCALSDDEADYIAACVKAVLCDKGVKTTRPAPPEALRRKSAVLRRLAAIRKEGLELDFSHAGTRYLLRALHADDLRDREIIGFLHALWKENRHILFTAGDPKADCEWQTAYLRNTRDALLFMVCGREEASGFCAERPAGGGEGYDRPAVPEAGREFQGQAGPEDCRSRRESDRLVKAAAGREFRGQAAPESGRVFWGHVGLEDFDFGRDSCRMDMLIMRAGAPRGLLAAACDRLFVWAREALGIRRMFNHIAADNKGSRLLAASHGFTTLHRVSLRRHTSPTGTAFRPMLRPNREQPDAGLIISMKELEL